jgi:hypothetical protein
MKRFCLMALILMVTSRAFCDEAQDYFNQGIEKGNKGD